MANENKMSADQIRKALKAGIITDEQAAAMLGANDASSNTAPTAALIGQEDDMRFLRSFSDVFIGIGLIILMLGASGLAALMGGKVSYLMAAGGVAILANYFGRVKRAHFPTLILALAFLLFVQRGLISILGGSGTLAALITAGAMSLFYWRIRLPFCIALIALALLYLLFSALAAIAPDFTKSSFGWVLLGAGLAVFSTALAYDTRDTQRLTRFADNAFWLHFIAAPMIIHGLAIMTISLKADVLFGFVPMVSLQRTDAALLLGVVAIITLIGLAINRRALIVSSFGYAAFALIYLFDGSGMKIGMSITSALLALGGAIVFLGVGWHSSRNQLIKLLPKWKIFPPPFED